jgi:hypothetical protein
MRCRHFLTLFLRMNEFEWRNQMQVSAETPYLTNMSGLKGKGWGGGVPVVVIWCAHTFVAPFYLAVEVIERDLQVDLLRSIFHRVWLGHSEVIVILLA